MSFDRTMLYKSPLLEFPINVRHHLHVKCKKKKKKTFKHKHNWAKAITLLKSNFHLTQLTAISTYKFGYAQIHFAWESFHLTIELYLVTTTILGHNYRLSGNLKFRTFCLHRHQINCLLAILLFTIRSPPISE